MPTDINSLNCKKYEQGVGLIDCLIRFGRPTTIIRTPNNWSFDPDTETFNLDYVVSKIQDGTFTPFLNTLAFTNNTGEPTRKEFQGGAVGISKNARPEHQYSFDNGIAWHAAAYSFNGFRTSSVIIIDENNNVRVQSNVAGDKLTGFKTNMFNTRTYRDTDGESDDVPTILEYQIDNTEAYNKRSVIITGETIGADLNDELMGIISVDIAGTVSAANGASITVTATLNNKTGIQGLTAANFRARNLTDDAVQAIDTVTAGETPGSYTIDFTVAPTASDEIVIETYDATATPPVAVAKVGDTQLYKGASATITVGA